MASKAASHSCRCLGEAHGGSTLDLGAVEAVHPLTQLIALLLDGAELPAALRGLPPERGHVAGLLAGASASTFGLPVHGLARLLDGLAGGVHSALLALLLLLALGGLLGGFLAGIRGRGHWDYWGHIGALLGGSVALLGAVSESVVGRQCSGLLDGLVSLHPGQ
ncbi:MAG: hypothetical protein M3459_07805 [Actinomycetota bacterium]|nr:hypothetical protein [Actinomycetota bacterium]